MKILDIYINGFGKFHGRNLSFEDGLNIVYGKNEAGKSTIHTFIRGMLFGIENSADGPPETICTPSSSRGRTAAPTRASCGWSIRTTSTALNGRFRRTRKNLRWWTRPRDVRSNRRRHFSTTF